MDPAPRPASAMPGVLRLLDPTGQRGVLVGSRCTDCAATALGTSRRCANCTSPRIEPVDLSPRGTLASFTIIHRAAASWPGPVPYALGVVELPEGISVTAEVVDCPFDRIRLGMPMELAVRAAGQDASSSALMVYKWTPCER